MARKQGKRITMKMVAEELGVSMMTVSRALNNSRYVEEGTRERVVETARRMGYFPDHVAKSMVVRKTRTLGVVAPEIAHSFFPDAIRGVEEAATERDYQIMLTHSAEDEKREENAVRTLVGKRVDGILISVAERSVDHEIYRQAVEAGVEIVFFDRCVFDLGYSCVSVNDKGNAFKMTEHLIKEHGYRRIAHLGGPERVSIGRDRRAGYLDALRANECEAGEDSVVESGFHERGGYEAMKRLLDLPDDRRPRAVVAVNDPAAFGAMKAIAERGLRIPEDLAVVGFSNDIRSSLTPTPLTTVDQRPYEVGKRAAEKLVAHVENEDEKPEAIILEGELVFRKSCGCPYDTKDNGYPF
ncbi:MAG: substrate-binding domain-containing protein [Ignavibacteriales bacterium]|nr:substrate-binding domain-containing protein [Ignavibacteriales bacterium]